MVDWFSPRDGTDTQALFVNVSRQATLLQDLQARMQARQGFSIATLNLDHVVKMQQNARFRAAYGQHSHITADGNPIVWLSRLAGRDVELVPGSELVRPILRLAAQQGVSVTLLGTTQPVLQKAADHLRGELPGLQIVDCISPPKGFDPDGAAADAYIDTLKRSGIGLIILALGAPKQELFAIRASKQLPQTGFVSVGAGLDFIAGAQVRAPRLMRALAVEWLWRLMSNPMRFAGRYGSCLAILPRLTASALRARKAQTSGKSHG